MGVDFLLILRFENKDELDGDQIVGVGALRQNKLRRRVYRQLRRILEFVYPQLLRREKECLVITSKM